MITTAQDIAAALATATTDFTNHIASLNEAKFTYAPAGKWSAGQQLEHLLRCTKPVYTALGLPAFVLRLLFGKSNRPSRNYDELVAKYKAKLLAGGAASGRFVPPSVSFAQQPAKLQQFTQLQQQLSQRVLRLSDSKLDGYLLPHPLLGKLTLREMLYFTIYHITHHLLIVQAQVQENSSGE